ncbi:jg14134, partial [Pararge aegeria aegeria]
AGTASLAPLVLQMFTGGGDHLTSGDPLARLPAINIKKILISLSYFLIVKLTDQVGGPPDAFWKTIAYNQRATNTSQGMYGARPALCGPV